MRELFKALSSLESELEAKYGVSLNEAMVLCSVGKETVTAGTIGERTGLMPSHTSKVIGKVEEKGLLVRSLGEKDKRQMYFTLTKKAHACLQKMTDKGVDVPDVLLPFFNAYKDDEEKEI